MKKNFLMLLAFFASCTLSFGKSVSVTTAKTVGYNYLHQRGGGLTSPDDLSLVYTSASLNTDFYVFGANNCFVLVSADDIIIPVLGYSTQQAFTSDHMPSQVAGFFENYNRQIDYAISNGAAATPEIATKWDNLVNNKISRSTERTTTVLPLLATTWDQSPDGINPSGYYNDDCPYDMPSSSLCVTGCVATATAQVMKFWNWPAHGTGINTYSTSSYGTLSADYGVTTYSWGSMPNVLSAHNPAVARLMSDVGISVNMDYSPTESSAYVVSAASAITNCAEYALKTYFNYDPSLHGEVRAMYADATWIGMIESDLTAGYPVIYTGTGTAGGHCFIFDGFDASNEFHVNWGWSGSDDGYFTIDALNPPSLGTGGGAGGFNSDQTAIFGVKPAGGGSTPTASLELFDYVNLTAPIIGYGGSFTATSNVENTGMTTFTGDFCAAAFDATSGSFITYVDSVMGTTLPSGDVFVSDLSFPTTGLLAMFPGNYTIGIFYRPTGGGWVAVPNSSSGFYTNFAPIQVVNSDPIELWSHPMTPSAAPFVQGSPASVTLNLTNNGPANFSGSYEVILLNLDGSLNSTIGTMTSMSLMSGASYPSDLTFGPATITAAPGSYYLTAAYNDGTGWYYAGADFFQNPILVTVVAPPPSPDMYEPNNTAAAAYDLSSTLSWVSNVAHTGTPGSNFHVVTDQDYYKLVLPSGYRYSITANVNDIIHPAGGTYTVDAVWSYSTDGGATWSTVYDDVMTGTPSAISVPGTGGTVIFHVSPHFAGNIGTYLLDISNITRVSVASVTEVSLESARIFPNPASDQITVDLTGTGAKAEKVVMLDMQGKKVYSADVSNQSVISIPVNSLAAGMYFVQVATDAGVLNKKITVSSK